MTIFYPHELPAPSDEYAFEEMCADVYGAVFSDTSPKRNGRRGQAQKGVDIFLTGLHGLIAIQCKRYQTGSLTMKHLQDEVDAADKCGVQIAQFIFATTAASDSKLVVGTIQLNELRRAAGLFLVEIDFWSEIQAHIQRRPELLARYSPNSPGGVVHNVQQQLAQMMAQMGQLQKSDPEAEKVHRAALDTLLNRWLDSAAGLQKAARYSDAEAQLASIEVAYASFELAQKARWHTLRAACRLHLHTSEKAIEDYLEAYRLQPNDERIVADRMSAARLRGAPEEAERIGKAALSQFHAAASIWAALALAVMDQEHTISEAFFPSELLGASEVLTVLCAAADKQDNFLKAWEYGQKILRHTDARPSHRTTAFGAALALTMARPLAPTAKALDNVATNALTDVIECFEPREEKLWRNQSKICLPADAGNLCYAYHLLGRYEDVLAVYAEANGQPEIQKRMHGIKLSALNAMGRQQDLVKEATEAVGWLQPASLLTVAEAAVGLGNVDLVDALVTRAIELNEDEEVDALKALRTLALLHAGRREEAVSAAIAISEPTAERPRAWLATIRTLIGAGEIDAALERIERIADRVDAGAPPSIQILLADCHYFVKQYAKAGAIYRRFFVPGTFNDLAARLFDCFVEAGMRANARELLSAMAPEWIDDDLARKASIRLAKRAGDWELLRKISEEQCQRRPDHVGARLLVLYSERYGGSMEKFLQLVRTLPEHLEGTIKQTAEIAAHQIQYGASEQGMRRLYRMVRADMQSDQVASAYLTTILGRGEIAELSGKPEVVGPGTTCVLVSADDSTVVITIEPVGFDDVPKQRNYFAPEDNRVLALIGKSVGETVTLPGAYGPARSLVIQSIEPVYRYTLTRLQRLTEEAAGGLPDIHAGKIVKKDGAVDLSPIEAMVQSGGNGPKHAFDTYAKMPMTLGMLAAQLDTTTLELVNAWPTDAAALRMRSGSEAETAKAKSVMSKEIGAIVIDLATLGDLVSLGCEAALGCAPAVYLSATAAQILRHLREKASGPSPVARVGDVGGKLVFFRYPEDYQARLSKFYDRIDQVVQRYCTVCPAYGTDSLPSEFVELDGSLGDDEYEALLLAVEKKAVLISLDMHLRELADTVLVRYTLWPQALLSYAAQHDYIPWSDYRNATQLLFRRHRHLTVIDAHDVLFMFLQGGDALQFGLQKLVKMFGDSDTNFKGAVEIIEAVIRFLNGYVTSLPALLEFVEILYEPLFRHPECPTDFGTYCDRQMRMFAERRRASVRGGRHGTLKAAEDQRVHGIYQLMTSRLETAAGRAKAPYKVRALPIRVLYATPQPEFVLDVLAQP
ncbi:PIN domain-containing protein [Janthinobacterium aestuarii]